MSDERTRSGQGSAERPREEEEHAEELRVTDRRRFTEDGQRREDVSEEGITPVDEGTEKTARPEMVPRSEAEQWERRALDAEAKIREITDAYRHHKTELDRARERLERDQRSRVLEALARSFLRVLDALDGLEMALEHSREGESPLAEGVRLVHRKILDALAAEGLERIEVVGETFDPELAEAVATVPVEDEKDVNRVIREIRPGYRLEGRVIRPAQVHVGIAAAKTDG
ncbi:MAG: nucleotide exchange factor GrpE [Acidobacteria bacterium]|nr:MAG: nucleotide exchange factor GrpE [Acidobacteriota bacterium]